MADLVLSAAEREAITEATRVLLSPLQFEGVDEWRRAVNRVTGDLLGADQRSFVLPRGDGGSFLTDDFDRETVRGYEAALAGVDRRFGVLRRASRARVTSRRTTWGRHIGEFYRSAYYNEVLVPCRAFDNLSAVVDVGARVPVQLMFNHERPSGRRFGRRGRQILGLLVPALEAGARAVRETEGRGRELGSLIDRLATAAVLVDARGTVRHRNAEAARLMGRPEDSAPLTRRLAALGRAMAPRRRRAGKALLVAPSASATLTLDATRVHMEATHVGGGALDGRTLSLVTITEEAPPPPTDRFGLTAREDEVARLVARRLTSREIAAELDISHHTVRRHTERIFEKLGVRSRRDVADKLEERA